MAMDRTPLVLGTNATICNVAWENDIKSKINSVLVNSVEYGDLGNYATNPVKFLLGMVPVYTSSSTISLSTGQCRNSLNSSNIVLSTPTTLDLTSTGANGYGQSNNFIGTVSLTAGSNIVTGSSDANFLANFGVGDVIFVVGVGGFRVTAVPSATNMTVATASTVTGTLYNFRRGGRAASTFYYLYAISSGSTGAVVLLTRNDAGGEVVTDLPNGYTTYRQLPFSLRTDTGGNILPFYVAEWSQRAVIYYMSRSYILNGSVVAGQTNITNSVTAASSGVSLQTFVPPISSMPIIGSISNGGYGVVSDTGSTNYTPVGASSIGSISTCELYSKTRTIDFNRTSASGSFAIDCVGFRITEV